LGRGPGPPYLDKKEATEERKVGRASKTKLGPPLPQGVDLPLKISPLYMKVRLKKGSTKRWGLWTSRN